MRRREVNVTSGTYLWHYLYITLLSCQKVCDLTWPIDCQGLACVSMKLVIWSNLEVQLLSLHVTLEFIYFCFMPACSYHVYFYIMSACSYRVYFFVMSMCSSQVYLHKMQLDEWVVFYLSGWELLPSASCGCHVKELDEEDLLETKGACVITAGLQSLDIWWNWCPQKEMVLSRSLNCFAAGSWP